MLRRWPLLAFALIAAALTAVDLLGYGAERASDRRFAWVLALALSSLVCTAVVVLLELWRHRGAVERDRAAAIMRAQFDLSPGGVLVLDAFDEIIAINRRFREIWNIPDKVIEDGDVARGRAILADQMVDSAAFVAAGDHLRAHPGESAVYEVELKDGRTIEHRTQPFELAPGRPAGRVWYVRDITQERAAIATRLELAAIVETCSDAIISTSLDGTVVSWNSAATAVYGYTAQEAIGLHASRLVPEDKLAELDLILKRIGQGEACGRFDTVRLHKSGRRIDVSVVVSPIFDAKGRVSGGSAIIRDVTDVKRYEDDLIRAARFDSLTGLPNRASFVDALEHAVVEARRWHRRFAVLFVDLDRFKDVNDTRGHAAGDQLLQLVGQRLRQTSRDTDIVARFGGDEFAVLCHDLPDARAVGLLAQQLLDALRAPFEVGGQLVQAGASIGVATYAQDTATAEAVLSHADIALYRAKSAGRGVFRLFTEEMDREVRERVALGAELRQAIGSDQLFLVYQPQVEAKTGAVVGLEALARWRHPQRGLVPPGVFIPIAEEMGLAAPLTRWVVGEVAAQLRAWLDAGIEPPLMAVNLSGADFVDGRDVEAELSGILQAHDIAPERLEIELTESILLDRSTETGETLARLHARGFRVAIDDFGTGYSSLDYVRRFPVDRIKIDRKFVIHLDSSPADAAIIKATIGLARALGLGVIAEGVETETQRDLLAALGCRLMQGYLFFVPMDSPAITALLRQPERLRASA
ncbi:MAG: EAL domain-containing protein [Caulobacteraceae bacterium]|nr:EAL domain-containing protein [Caulobacteraceae bacterium]